MRRHACIVLATATGVLAIAACGSSGKARGPSSAVGVSSAIKFAACVRAHGVPDFPDPDSSPPANPAGLALAFGRPGAFIVIPETLNPQSPTFKQAAKTCRLPGA